MIEELVAANRILAAQGVLDAFGHVSARDPEDPARFLLARSRSPELVTADDLMTFTLDGAPAGGDARGAYVERFIHAAIYERRPDVLAVVHSHAEDVIPFSVTGEPLRPVLHTAAAMGARVPVWDIRERFGDRTNLLVSDREQGRDLAARLGDARVVLMRGHGFAAAGRSLYEAVKIAIYLPRNARALATALRFGDVVTLSDGEVEALSALGAGAPSSQRAWEYWCSKLP